MGKGNQGMGASQGRASYRRFSFACRFFRNEDDSLDCRETGLPAVIAVVVVLQPELRKALENLGRKNIVLSIFPLDMMRSSTVAGFSDKTVNEIIKACIEMGKAKTGALIVVEHKDLLSE